MKDELAQIVRGVRRVLEREQAAGIGELFAASAARIRAGIESIAPGAEGLASTEPESRSPREPGMAERAERLASRAQDARGERPAESRPALPPLAPASETEVDLFGKPLPRATIEQVSPEHSPRVDDLAPAGIVRRAEIVRAAVPVLEQIAGEVRACRLCGLCESRTNAVPGVGSAASGIVFVGEAPGAEEDRRGEPFVGRAGDLLTKIIQAMDEAHLVPGVSLSRESVYICNVLKCRPPENRNPLPHEIELCSPYLERQLAALRPRVICCLGKFAAELLVGAKGTIAGLRGKVYRYQGAKLIVTYHPAACLRNPAYKRPVWEDMQLLAREYLTD